MRAFSCWNVKIQRSCIAKSKLTKLQIFTQDNFHQFVTRKSDEMVYDSISVDVDSPSGETLTQDENF